MTRMTRMRISSACLHIKCGAGDPLRSRLRRSRRPPHEGDTNYGKMSDRILPLVRGRAAEGGRGSMSRTLCAKPCLVLVISIAGWMNQNQRQVSDFAAWSFKWTRTCHFTETVGPTIWRDLSELD